MKILFALPMCVFAVIADAFDLNSTSIEGKVSDGQRVKYKCDGNESILRFIVIIVYCDYFEKGVGIYFTPNLVLTVADVMFTEKIKKRNSAWIGTGIFHIPEPEMFKVVPVKASTVEMELNSIKVISIKTHPGYKYKNYINNIAVLKAPDGPFSMFDQKLFPVRAEKLPNVPTQTYLYGFEETNRDEIQPGTIYKQIRTDERRHYLKKVKINLSANLFCYEEINHDLQYVPYNQFCATTPSDTTEESDIGSPLISNNELLGLHMLGKGRKGQTRAFYLSIPGHNRFINKFIQEE